MDDSNDQEKDERLPVERRPYARDPTKVEHTRVSTASTVTNSGLGGGRPEGGATVTPERARTEDRMRKRPDVQGGHDQPRENRAQAGDDDSTTPADDQEER
jgi:hypothetical protein